MKVVIAAGGLGTRLAEETDIRPKPMVEIGGMPILWHIMKHYSHYGHDEFVIAGGYKVDYIKRWMADAMAFAGDMVFNFGESGIVNLERRDEPWNVIVADTGLPTEVGSRIKRCQRYLDDGTFLFTYGDGVSNVDLDALVDFHRSQGRIATLTAVRPVARFGHLNLASDRVASFDEKPQLSEGWINGGFFVFEPEIFDWIGLDDDDFARTTLPALAAAGELSAYRHPDFWQCMDTMRDKDLLQTLWETRRAPWATWDLERSCDLLVPERAPSVEPTPQPA